MRTDSSDPLFSEDNIEDESDWLVTYADMMTLLLVFFILLYSISTVNLEKFKGIISSIQISLGNDRPPVQLLEVLAEEGAGQKPIVIEEMIGLRSRKEKLLNDNSDFILTQPQGNQVMMDTSNGKITIRVVGQVLFESGQARLNPRADPIMYEILDIIRNYPDYQVNIRGYSDNVPISTPRYPSNWHLSAIRATNVLKYLIRGGIPPERLTATGYGELSPLVPNTTPENRAKNRRVEFVLEKEKE